MVDVMWKRSCRCDLMFSVMLCARTLVGTNRKTNKIGKKNMQNLYIWFDFIIFYTILQWFNEWTNFISLHLYSLIKWQYQQLWNKIAACIRTRTSTRTRTHIHIFVLFQQMDGILKTNKERERIYIHRKKKNKNRNRNNDRNKL